MKIDLFWFITQKRKLLLANTHECGSESRVRTHTHKQKIAHLMKVCASWHLCARDNWAIQSGANPKIKTFQRCATAQRVSKSCHMCNTDRQIYFENVCAKSKWNITVEVTQDSNKEKTKWNATASVRKSVKSLTTRTKFMIGMEFIGGVLSLFFSLQFNEEGMYDACK